jgi:hypothetical protein
MFAGTIAEVYGFDLDALTPVAARIGPEVSLIHTPLPLSEIPADSQTAAFSMQASSGLMF